jgi:hypothetical protein
VKSIHKRDYARHSLMTPTKAEAYKD